MLLRGDFLKQFFVQLKCLGEVPKFQLAGEI